MLPSPFDPSPSDEQISQSISTIDRSDEQVDYDWAAFISAYALGRWDPLRTPQPPRSYLDANSITPSRSVLHTIVTEVTEASEQIFESPIANVEEPDMFSEESIGPMSGVPSEFEDVIRTSVEGFTRSAPPSYHLPTVLASSPTKVSASVLPEGGITKLSDRRTHNSIMNLGPFVHRMRNSWADIRSSASLSLEGTRGNALNNADITTSAAAIRWAGARVSVAPLALPSPEHELTDPMRGVTAAIPGAHPEPLPVQSPTGIRKTRLSSFWQGTQDVEDKLSTIEASPAESAQNSTPQSPPLGLEHDKDVDKSRTSPMKPPTSIPFVGPSVVPATAPIRISTDPEEQDDYFGNIEQHHQKMSNASPALSTGISEAHSHTTSSSRPDVDFMRQSSAPPFDVEPSTVPALPRRICLTRQTSAPIPSLALYERRLRATRPASDGSITILQGRAAKEEQMYNELGYLAPPNPPDELERRRALYKYVCVFGLSQSNFTFYCFISFFELFLGHIKWDGKEITGKRIYSFDIVEKLEIQFLSPLTTYFFLRFNIWNTGHDVNFDRIAHLVKLVFNTRIVVIALIDGTDM